MKECLEYQLLQSLVFILISIGEEGAGGESDRLSRNIEITFAKLEFANLSCAVDSANVCTNLYNKDNVSGTQSSL